MGTFLTVCLIFKILVIIVVAEQDCIWNYKCCISEIDDRGYKKCMIMCPPVIKCEESPQIAVPESFSLLMMSRIYERFCRTGYKRNSVGKCVKVYWHEIYKLGLNKFSILNIKNCVILSRIFVDFKRLKGYQWPMLNIFSAIRLQPHSRLIINETKWWGKQYLFACLCSVIP